MVTERAQSGHPRLHLSLALLSLALIGLGLGGCGSHVWHHVKQGETLYSISWRYGQDYQQVAAWNDITAPYIIKPGQALRIAPPVGRRSQRSTDSRSAAIATNKTEARPDPTQKAATVTAGTVPADAATVAASPASRPDVQAYQNLRNAPANVSWQWPVQGQILSHYSTKGAGNKGIDIAGRSGLPVKAAAEGKVVYAGSGLPSYGRLLIIKHNDKYLSAYAHNDDLLVQEGDYVEAGQTIATMGKTGTDRYKLHFEIRHYGQPKNPLKFLPKQ